MRVLALDVGDVRIGVACSDELGITAQPVGVLKRRELAADLAQVTQLIATHAAERVVVGLPLRMTGSDSPQTAKVRAFADALAAVAPVPVELADERLSTVEAEEILRRGRARRRKRKQMVDVLAAQVILRDWLDEHQRSL